MTNKESPTSDVVANNDINNLINRMKLAHPEIIDPNPVPIEQNTDEQTNTIEDTIPEATDDETVPETTDDKTVPEATDDGTVPEATDESGSKSSPFTDEQLKKIYDSYKVKYIQDDSGNEIETVVPFTRKSLIRLLTATNDDGIKIRQLFGFPENMNKSQFNTGTEFNKIFANILTTVGTDEKDMNMSAPVSDENDISFEEFKRFVECGTYRDKNTDDNFNCIHVKPPQTTTDDTTDSEATDKETPDSEATDKEATDKEATNKEATDKETTDSEATDKEATDSDSVQNIELEINEQQYNNTKKRIDISLYVPNNSEVIVRDYAKNSLQETIKGLGTYSSTDPIE